MDARMIVGGADFLDAAGDALHERGELFALQADVLGYDLE